MSSRISRRAVISGGVSVLSVPAIVGIKSLYEPSQFEVNHVPVFFPKLTESLKKMGILHQSDIHADPESPVVEHASVISSLIDDRTTKLGLDPRQIIAANSGDYTSKWHDESGLGIFMKAQEEREQAYLARMGSLGNHDYETIRTVTTIEGSETKEEVSIRDRARVRTVLENSDYLVLNEGPKITTQKLIVGDGHMNVLGLPDYDRFRMFYSRRLANKFLSPELNKNFKTIPEQLEDFLDPETLNLIVVHNLSELDGVLNKIGVEERFSLLVLAGHTHGGQTAAPGLQFKSGYMSDMFYGLYKLGQKVFVHVSAGLGASESSLFFGARARFLRPPESTLITLGRR